MDKPIKTVLVTPPKQAPDLGPVHPVVEQQDAAEITAEAISAPSAGPDDSFNPNHRLQLGIIEELNQFFLFNIKKKNERKTKLNEIDKSISNNDFTNEKLTYLKYNLEFEELRKLYESVSNSSPISVTYKLKHMSEVNHPAQLRGIIERFLSNERKFKYVIGLTARFIEIRDLLHHKLFKLNGGLQKESSSNNELIPIIKDVMKIFAHLEKQKQWSYGDYMEQVFTLSTPDSASNQLIDPYEIDVEFPTHSNERCPVEITSLCSFLDEVPFKSSIKERLNQKYKQLNSHKQKAAFEDKYKTNKEQLLIVVKNNNQRQWAYEVMEAQEKDKIAFATPVVKNNNQRQWAYEVMEAQEQDKIAFATPFKNKPIPRSNNLIHLFPNPSNHCCVIITEDELTNNMNFDKDQIAQRYDEIHPSSRNSDHMMGNEDSSNGLFESPEVQPNLIAGSPSEKIQDDRIQK